MLYDPKWEVKADPLSLESLIAWLEKQPANGVYDAVSADKCLLAQWLKSQDRAARLVGGGNSFRYSFNGSTVELNRFDPVVFGMGEYTFGAALHRARRM